jgi:RNase P subunit RPR2
VAFLCPVCDQNVGHFKCSQLKDGVVCNACFEKSGLKKAGFPAKLVEVWEVVTACDMNEDEKQDHIAKKRERLQQENEAAKERMASMATSTPAAPPVPTCKKCGSTSISGNKKGYSLMTGFIGANKVKITCMNCGHQWTAGKQ